MARPPVSTAQNGTSTSPSDDSPPSAVRFRLWELLSAMTIVAVSLATAGPRGLVIAIGLMLTYLAAFNRLNWFRLHAKTTWTLSWVIFGISLFLPAVSGGCRSNAHSVPLPRPLTATSAPTEESDGSDKNETDSTHLRSSDALSADYVPSVPGWFAAWFTLMMSTAGWYQLFRGSEDSVIGLTWYTTLTLANLCLLASPLWLMSRLPRLQAVAVVLYSAVIASTWSVAILSDNSVSADTVEWIFALRFGYFAWVAAHLLVFLAAPVSRRHWAIIVCAVLIWIGLNLAGAFS